MAKAKKIPTTGSTPEIDHYKQIVELEGEVRVARNAYEGAKEAASLARKEFDKLADELLNIIHGGPDWQKRLPLGEE